MLTQRCIQHCARRRQTSKKVCDDKKEKVIKNQSTVNQLFSSNDNNVTSGRLSTKLKDKRYASINCDSDTTESSRWQTEKANLQELETALLAGNNVSSITLSELSQKLQSHTAVTVRSRCTWHRMLVYWPVSLNGRQTGCVWTTIWHAIV